MQQTPRRDDEDIRLSENEIRAMSENLRRQYIKSDERSVVGTVGSAVIGGVEGVIRRILIFLRLPVIVVFIIAGFLLLNGREGVSFVVALLGAGVGGIIGAGVTEALVRFIDARAYRRDVG